MKIELKGLDILRAEVDDLIKSRIPTMTAMALTETAKKLKDATHEQLKKVFDRPTPYTVGDPADPKTGAFYFTSASAKALSATVGIKNMAASKYIAPSKYLTPEIEGGPRNLKRFESALKKIGVLPDGYYIVPGEKCKLDAHGNIDHGLIIQILSYFRAFREAGYRANITDKGKARRAKGSKRTGVRGFRYFVGRPGSDGIPRRGKDFRPASNLPLGIWRTTEFAFGSGRVEPIMIFVKGAPDYRKRFNFYTWAQYYVDTEFPGIFRRLAAETLEEFHRSKAGR